MSVIIIYLSFSHSILLYFLDSFIQNFGTHVITSVTIGGKDVIYVKQHQTSPLSTLEIKNYVQDIGDHRFSSTENLTSSGLLKYKDKASSHDICCFLIIKEIEHFFLIFSLP